MASKIGSALFGTPGEKQPSPEYYISNTLENRQLYKKSYLIEFWSTSEFEPDDVFTFSIPPESEELTYTQRRTETKTFGGLHVDDYGIDAVKIVLSGSTVNQSLKLIYRGGKSSKWLSGEEEIYYLRDLIMKHKSINNLIGKEKKEKKIIIYDLSKTVYFKTKEGFSTPVKNYWQAFPGDFKIRRASDKPFTYKYSFEFTGIPLEEGKEFNSHGDGKPPGLEEGKLGLIQRAMNGLIAVMDFVDGINGKVNNVLDKVNQVSKLLKLLGNVTSYSTNTLSGIIDSAGDSVVGLTDGTTNIVNGTNSVISLPRTVQLKALNVGLEIQNATNGLMKAVADLVEDVRGMFEPGGDYWEIPKEVLDQYAVNSGEFQDSINRMLNEAENASCELAAAAKSSVVPEVTVGNPDPITGEQRIVLSYGSTGIILKDTDSLESLATEYMGGPDKAIDIATYNGVASLSDLEPGAIILIPITRRTAEITNNLIYARRENRENYGRDILLTDDGYIVASSSGDYELSEGTKNLSQAILLRLRERVKRRIRLIAYGIKTNVSAPTAGVAYVISSIDLTVNGDPRVASVEDIQFRGQGDQLIVNVIYKDINNTSGNAAGRV
jgi:hypothetical protein